MGDATVEAEDSDASTDEPTPRLASRGLVTWIELAVVGITGGVVVGSLGGPPGFVVYLFTTLISVGILFYNVNQFVAWWVRTAGVDG